jgi:biopolymer transport protein ExbB
MNFFNLKLIEEGGLLMLPLFALSIFGFILFFERALFLHKAKINSRNFISGIKNLLEKQSLVEALTVCEETPGPVARIIKSALLNHEKDEQKIRNAVQRTALAEIPFLEKGIRLIGLIGRVAPLIGLLGTVVGLTKGFFSLERNEGAYGNISLVAGGAYEALLTTGTGLAIGIMAILAYHFLMGQVYAFVHDMEWVANDMTEFLTQNQQR